MNYKEVNGDLFTDNKADMLVHCISRDAAMGAGIAKIFRSKYPDMKKHILDIKPNIGDAVNYFDRENKRYIANLITKEKFFNKPTYNTFEQAIKSLKQLAIDKGVAHIAMPKIGAGLDRLNWEKNREIIQEVFKNVDIEIVVYIL